jgi:transposase InsO family protein
MDFKGVLSFGGGQLYPLTVVDDHSRYAVVVQAVDNQRRQTVQIAVQAAFEHYGLPDVIPTDNGPPTLGRHSRALAATLQQLG